MFKHINWDTNIYVTKNFMQTAENSNPLELTNVEHSLRLVDAAIQFEGSSTVTLLLLSDREADSILALYWERQLLNQSSRNSFVNVSFLKNSARTPNSGAFPLQLCLCDHTTNSHMLKYLSGSAIASVQLFSGDTMFAPDEEEALRTVLLTTLKGKQVASRFTEFRETQHHLARSVLENVSGSDLV